MTPERRETYLAYQRKWRKENPEYAQEWRAANVEKRKTLMADWSKTPNGLASRAQRQKRYRERHRERIVEKNAKYFRQTLKGQMLKRKELAIGRPKPAECEICKSSGGQLGIVFDHCHRTGEARGWLCSKCNSALGMADDDPRKLRALADYLEAFARRTDEAIA